MPDQKKKKPKITYVERVFNIWGLVLILWSLYRSYFGTALPVWFDEFIAKPAIFLTPVFLFIRHYDKQSLLTVFGSGHRINSTDVVVGLAAGSVFFIVGALNGTMTVKPVSETVYIILIALCSSVVEEILSRGFVLRKLYENSRKFVTSIIFASVLFFIIHVPILFTDPAMHGSILIRAMFVNLILSGVVSTVFLIRRGNLTAPILIHALYVMSVAFSR